jgi:hypothetical protein
MSSAVVVVIDGYPAAVVKSLNWSRPDEETGSPGNTDESKSGSYKSCGAFGSRSTGGKAAERSGRRAGVEEDDKEEFEEKRKSESLKKE